MTGHGPVNRFCSIRNLASANQRTVDAPNDDTLYSLAWLDLSKQPQVIHAPQIRNRFWEFELVDPWTNDFFNITSAHLKMGAGDFNVTGGGNWAVVGPGFKGRLPHGVIRVKSRYDRVWIVGRTYIRGPQDLRTVHRIQNQYTITPLSKFGTPYTAATAQEDHHQVNRDDDPRHPAGRGSTRVLYRARQGDAEVPGAGSRPAAAREAQGGRRRPRAQSRERAPQPRHAPRPARRGHARAQQGSVRRAGALPPRIRQAQRLPRDRSRLVGHELHAARDRRPPRRRRPAGKHRDLPGRPVRRHQSCRSQDRTGTSFTSRRAACRSP